MECRPSSTVIGRLLYIFTHDIVGAAGLDLWSNGVLHGTDGADAHGFCITVSVIVPNVI